MTEIELEKGKYTVLHEDGANFRALRHGEPWRDLTGDGLVLAMAYEIERLREAVARLSEQIEDDTERAARLDAEAFERGDENGE